MVTPEAIGELEVCWDCKTTISWMANRAFTFGADGVLCWSCAVRRGGIYEAAHDRWTRAPEIGDLLDPFADQ
jgi:hypothetical protein